MRIAVIAAVVAAIFVTAAPAKAKQTREPVKTAKPTVPAKPSVLQLASEGDVAAQFALGLAYLKGDKAMAKDPAQAVEWLSLASANGNADAAQSLAKGYEQGWFGKPDQAQAASWWYRAGALGIDDGRDRFLTLYLGGQAPSIIGATGVRWLEQLADGGDSRAILALGRVFETGDGGAADHAKAQRWYRLGALAGDVEAQYRLGAMLLAEPAGWRLLFTDSGREKDNTERDRLYPSRAAAQDQAGDDRRVDIMRPGMIHGEYWLTLAAQRGSAQAALTLGQAYLSGRDLPFDLSAALHWLSVAALDDEPHAMRALADLAASGQGFFAPDPVRAWVNYQLAAQAGLDDAQAPRDALAKTMNAKQLSRARQIAAFINGN